MKIVMEKASYIVNRIMTVYDCVAIPLEETTKDIPNFVNWVLQSFVLALSGFWLPFVLAFLYKDFSLLETILMSSPFTIYSITFLSQKLVLNFSALKINKNDKAATARSIVSILTIMLILLQVGVWTNYLMNHKQVDFFWQVIIFLITVFMGILLYGMQGSKWEESLGEVPEKQTEGVDQMAASSDEVSDDGEGVEL